MAEGARQVAGSEVVIGTRKRLDALARQLIVQSESLEEVASLALRKKEDGTPRPQSPSRLENLLVSPLAWRSLTPHSRTRSATCISCASIALDLRQTMPIERRGCGSRNRATETAAERVSTVTAISGIRVTPIPTPTICTNVESELPSSISRGCDEGMSQKESA